MKEEVTGLIRHFIGYVCGKNNQDNVISFFKCKDIGLNFLIINRSEVIYWIRNSIFTPATLEGNEQQFQH